MERREDVEIRLAHDRKYKLHSGQLARCSTFFANLLTEENAITIKPSASKAGVTTRWIIELQKLPDEKFPAGQLGLVKFDNKARPQASTLLMPRNENGKVSKVTRLFDSYDAIFRAFYGKDFYINDEDMVGALQDAVGIIEIAEYLGCVRFISKPIDVAFFKQGQVLFRSIAQRPWSWAGMALRIKSEMLFKESLIHLVGNWAGIQSGVKDNMDPALRKLCEKHVDHLSSKKKAFEMVLASLYPGNMTTPGKQPPFKKDDYAKDILVWMALSFFRHWFMQRVLDTHGRNANDGGYALYQQLGKAGSAYLGKDHVMQLQNKFQLTKKAMNVLENHLLEIKECVKSAIEKHGLLVSNCQLDVLRYPPGHLTCVEITKKDFLWNNDREEGRNNSKPLQSRPAAGGAGWLQGGQEAFERKQLAARRLAEIPERNFAAAVNGGGSDSVPISSATTIKRGRPFVDSDDDDEQGHDYKRSRKPSDA